MATKGTDHRCIFRMKTPHYSIINGFFAVEAYLLLSYFYPGSELVSVPSHHSIHSRIRVHSLFPGVNLLGCSHVRFPDHAKS